MIGNEPKRRATCEQGLRLQPLLPERRPLAGPPSGDQEGARGVLAEARAEERRAADLLHDELLELVRRRASRSATAGGASASGRWSAMPSSRPDRLHLERRARRGARLERQRPRGVDAAAERRQDADPPVADLVAEALDDDRAVGRAAPPVAAAWSSQVGEQVRGRALVEAVVAAQASPRPVASDSADELPGERAPSRRPSSNGRPTPSPFQNGTAPGTPGAGETSTRSRVISSIRHVEAPSMKVSPCARLVDHLLVELADPAAPVDAGRRRRGRGRGSCRAF